METNKSHSWDDEFFDDSDETHGRCSGCKNCKTVHCNGGYEFYGCFHKPYRGKWIAEIKECPKEMEEKKGEAHETNPL